MHYANKNQHFKQKHTDMKNLALLFVLAHLLWTGNVLSQCLPDGITFATQEQIDDFKINYPNCTEIEGSVIIMGYDINNLNGLNVITSIGGGLQFIGNPFLTSLTGLNNLTSVGAHLTINQSDTLANLSGLDNLSSIGGHILITQNKILTSLIGLESVTSIKDNLDIYQNDALTSLTGLDNVSSIEGGLTIEDNQSLESLAGLDKVTSIEGWLGIVDNEALTNLIGLDNLVSIGGSLAIGAMYDGDNTSLISLTGLDNLTSIGGLLWIRFNPNLISLTGLNHVTSIGGPLWITDNNALINLTGLNNIDATSIDSLLIYDNPSLSICEVKSVCDYLISPTGTIEIRDNASGCDNQTEVKTACTSSVNEKNINDYISIFPNPTNSRFNFASTDLLISELNIYNKLGQIVLTEFRPDKTIDISSINPGLYIVEFITSKYRFKKKLIIK